MLQSYTDRAKTKYKKRPDLLPQVELIPDIPTPEGLDQLERLDHAIKLSAQLVKVCSTTSPNSRHLAHENRKHTRK